MEQEGRREGEWVWERRGPEEGNIRGMVMVKGLVDKETELVKRERGEGLGLGLGSARNRGQEKRNKGAY